MPEDQPSTTTSDETRNLTDADIEALADAIARQTSGGRTDAARRGLNHTIRDQAANKRKRRDARIGNRLGWGRTDDGGTGD